MILVRFRLGVIKLRGDSEKLTRAVDMMRRDVREGNARLDEYEAAFRRLRTRVLREVEKALIYG